MILRFGLAAVVLIGIIAFTWQFFFAPDVEPLVTPAPQVTQVQNPNQTWECNADAFVCPDGSAVGRTGPNCEFAACPADDATEAEVTTFVGGMVTRMFVTVAPKKVLSDSRCLPEVRCIWAGTVEVQTVLSTPVAHGEHTLRLGEPQNFGEHSVTLIEVTPGPRPDGPIPESEYRFTFKIEKKLAEE